MYKRTDAHFPDLNVISVFEKAFINEQSLFFSQALDFIDSNFKLDIFIQ